MILIYILIFWKVEKYLKMVRYKAFTSKITYNYVKIKYEVRTSYFYINNSLIIDFNYFEKLI